MDHSQEFVALVAAARQRVVEVTIEDTLRRRAAGATLRLIDVREDDEWRAGHAAGAEHLGRGVIERDIVARAPNKDEELVLYCGGGYRSVLAAESLAKMGYTRVRSLIGGYKEWVRQGRAIEVAPGEVAPGEGAPGEVAPGEVAPGEVALGEGAPGPR
jgi:rhodanese-related sulfurtransferase